MSVFAHFRLSASAVLLFLCFTVAAQEHDETPSDPYLPPQVTASPAISPAYQFDSPTFTVRQVNVDANGNNILNDAANEPSIAVDPVNKNRMAIGWRQFDNVQSNFRQAGFGYTTDGGQHWTFPGVIDSGVFRSDPVLAADAEGRFYYNSLTVSNGNDFQCTVYRSVGDGAWDTGAYAVGGDKQWMTIDRTDGPGHDHIYCNWNLSFSTCDTGDFTRSVNQGDSFEDCSRMSPTLYWGSCDVGPDGTVYFSGADGDVASSPNAQFSAQQVTWNAPSFADLHGHNAGDWQGESPNPAGIIGQSWISTNHAAGPLHGQVYVLQSVAANDDSDPADVMFARSTDGGQTWSAPVRVNDDDPNTPTWQWFGTMSVAPNGRIDAVWLDTRDNPDALLSSLYYAYSDDGGVTWSPNQRLSEAFDPHIGWPNQNKMGDYFHMVSDNEGAHLAWCATFNGEQDVYYGHIMFPQSSTSSPSDLSGWKLYPAEPNPFSDYTRIKYEVAEAGDVRLLIYDQTGTLVRTLERENQMPGTYSLEWDGRNAAGADAPAGLYTCYLGNGKQVRLVEKVSLIR